MKIIEDDMNELTIEFKTRLEIQKQIITKQDKIIELFNQQINNLKENK